MDERKDTPLVIETNDTSPTSSPPDNSDILFLAILGVLFFSFLYFFIRYLLVQSRSFKQVKDLRQKEDLKGPDLSDRRFRFGRIRRSSGGRPWLNPLDPSPSNTSVTAAKESIADNIEDHDADCIIKSVITTEAALQEHDPFASLTKTTTSIETSSANVFELSDHFGFFSAGILAILCIFLLSNLEE